MASAAVKNASEDDDDDGSEDGGDAEEAAEVLFSLVAVGSGPGERDRELGSGAVSLQAIVEARRDVVSRQIEVVDESGGVRRPLGTLRVSVRALELLTTLKSSQVDSDRTRLDIAAAFCTQLSCCTPSSLPLLTSRAYQHRVTTGEC